VQLSLRPPPPSLPRRILTLGIGTEVATRRFLAAMRHPNVLHRDQLPFAERMERIFAEMRRRGMARMTDNGQGLAKRGGFGNRNDLVHASLLHRSALARLCGRNSAIQSRVSSGFLSPALASFLAS